MIQHVWVRGRQIFATNNSGILRKWGFTKLHLEPQLKRCGGAHYLFLDNKLPVFPQIAIFSSFSEFLQYQRSLVYAAQAYNAGVRVA